ncbi:MAG: BatD family protein [Deltaproteobacteria bacterium]
MKAGRTEIATLFVAIFLYLAGVAHAAGRVEAWLDRNQVSLGETVQLTIQAEGRLSGDLDTSPLERDFHVLGTSSGSSINIVNGSMRSSKTWQISLAPKRQGTLTVPSLKIGGQHTKPLSLTVAASPSPQASSGADVFIETEVAPQDPYERQEVLYQIRLFHAVQLAKGSLTAPQPNNTVVQQVGKDRTYDTTVSGRHYEVIERTYALFPQQAGKLTVAPPVFDGQVIVRSHGGNSFDPFFGHDPMGMFTTTRSVRITGRSATFTVRPRPAGSNGSTWLPADSVALSEKWRPEQDTVRVGDAVTRTVTIAATGQNGAALPELAPAGVDGFKVYPDKSEVKSESQNGTICGTSRQKVAFIPVKPGTFTLPAVNLTWWDVKEKRQREASLPARTITVLPGGGQFAAAAPPPAKPQQEPQKTEPPVVKAKSLPVPVVQPAAARQFPWPLIALGLGAGWLFTLLLWARTHRRSRQKKTTPPAQPAPSAATPVGDPRKEFLAACKSGDARRARHSLLQWAAQFWPNDPPKGLSDLAARMEGEQAAREIAELDRFLFGSQPDPWDGHKLASLLRRFPVTTSREPGKKTLLPPLYPGEN